MVVSKIQVSSCFSPLHFRMLIFLFHFQHKKFNGRINSTILGKGWQENDQRMTSVGDVTLSMLDTESQASSDY